MLWIDYEYVTGENLHCYRAHLHLDYVEGFTFLGFPLQGFPDGWYKRELLVWIVCYNTLLTNTYELRTARIWSKSLRYVQSDRRIQYFTIKTLNKLTLKLRPDASWGVLETTPSRRRPDTKSFWSPGQLQKKGVMLSYELSLKFPMISLYSISVRLKDEGFLQLNMSSYLVQLNWFFMKQIAKLHL